MASRLQVGAAAVDITPPLGAHMQGFFQDRQAEDIADPLYARAIVLQNESVAMAIVVCDIIGACRSDLDIARTRVAELTDIPAAHVFLSCTHTHYGPTTLQLAHIPKEEAYTEWAMRKAADAVKLAVNRLRPAKVGVASGLCPEETHNRRFRMRDGTVKTNPGIGNTEILEAAGPVDPEVGLAVFLDEQDSPIAALGNYSLHYVSSGAPVAISANYFGAFSRALQRMAGTEFVAIMANGCCGDINNVNPLAPSPPMPQPHYQVERVGNVIAARACAAWNTIHTFDPEPILGVGIREIEFERRTSSADELAVAKDAYGKQDDIGLLEWVYASEALKLAGWPTSWSIPIMGLRIGDLGIAGLPCEAFVEYGLQIKERSPFVHTMAVELANDFVGYCPTDVALDEGGYETRLCCWAMAAKGTERKMVEAGIAVLDELAELN
ncbi:MAG: hypothetical protein HN742_29835 [Lentisphaerae bacterium]|jgi:neutral ceramidase|nr:hypothetical protein [Lentisphaerota bacterium]MBT4816911.1 hypothetical protein [Lentisphaerota bacterium]MBT5608299.1 hypothetical protein [Lentisphaerota bacterium]MBT7061801.1 hypothetical protein [Lentisphaerota bacterium]MBT7846110.1 hypothetical protein [Lentisphaerota bacterium]